MAESIECQSCRIGSAQSDAKPEIGIKGLSRHETVLHTATEGATTADRYDSGDRRGAFRSNLLFDTSCVAD